MGNTCVSCVSEGAAPPSTSEHCKTPKRKRSSTTTTTPISSPAEVVSSANSNFTTTTTIHTNSNLSPVSIRRCRSSSNPTTHDGDGAASPLATLSTRVPRSSSLSSVVLRCSSLATQQSVNTVVPEDVPAPPQSAHIRTTTDTTANHNSVWSAEMFSGLPPHLSAVHDDGSGDASMGDFVLPRSSSMEHSCGGGGGRVSHLHTADSRQQIVFSRPPPLTSFAAPSSVAPSVVVTIAPPSPRMFMPPASFVSDYNTTCPKTPRSANNNSNAMIRRVVGEEFYDDVDDALGAVSNPLKLPVDQQDSHFYDNARNHLHCASMLSPSAAIPATLATSGLALKHAPSSSWHTSSSPGSLSRWSSSRSSPVILTSSSRDASPPARVVVIEGDRCKVPEGGVTSSSTVATPSCLSPVYGGSNATSFKNITVLQVAVPESPKTSRSTSLVSKSHVSVLLNGHDWDCSNEGEVDEGDDGDDSSHTRTSDGVVESRSSSSSMHVIGNTTASPNMNRQSSSMSEDNHPAVLKVEPPPSGDYDDDVCGTNEVSVSYDEDDVAQQRLLSNEAEAAAHERCSEDDETFRHLEASDIVDSDALLGSPETNAELVARVQNAVRHWKPISSTESLVPPLGSVVGGGGGGASLLPQNNGVASTTAATSPPPLVAGCSQPLPLTTASSGSSAVFGQLTEETLGGMSYEDLLNWSNEHAHQLDDEACSIVKRRRYPRRADGTLILSAIPLSARLGDSRFQQRAALLRRGCQDGSGEVGCGVMSPSFAGNKRQRCYSTMLVGSRFTVPTSNLLATPRAASAESATALRGHSGVDFNVPAVHPDTEGDGVDQTHGAQRARRQRRTTGVVTDAAALPLPPLGTSLQ